MKKLTFILVLFLIYSFTIAGCKSNSEIDDIPQEAYDSSQSISALEKEESEIVNVSENLPFDEDAEILEIGSYGENGDNVKCCLYSNGHLYVYGEGNTIQLSCEVTYSLGEDGFSYQGGRTQAVHGIFDTNNKVITDVFIQDGVTGIGNGAFAYCDDLCMVEIPDSVTKIGDYAFLYCNSLENIVIPGSVKKIGEEAFMFCDSVTEVIIEDGIEEIGKAAFLKCDKINSIEIPETVKKIDSDAFAVCSKLSSIVFKGDKPEFEENVFYNVNATVYYPKGNSSWSEDDNTTSSDLWYGGNIKLVAFDPEKGITFDEDIASDSESDAESDMDSESETETVPLDWKTFYKEFLSDYTSQPGCHFGLLYIDEDDIPELVVTETLVGNGSGSLYTIYDNKVKSIGRVSAYGTFYYKEKGNLMMGYSLAQGYNSTGFTSIIDGEREYVHTFFDNALSGESPVVYKMDDQEISKSEYDQKLKELQEGMTACDFSKLPDINDANIANALS